MMGLSMRQDMSPKLEQKTSVKIALALRLSQTRISPIGNCSNCGYVLTKDEIQRGWRNDPTDFTTQCPSCGHRFVASLILIRSGEEEDVERVEYLCPQQLFAELEKVQRGTSKRLGKLYLYNTNPHLLWNMIYHFESYEEGLKAFRAQQ